MINNIFLQLNGPIEQIYKHYEMSYVFNVGLITPLHTSYPMFSFIFKFLLTHIYKPSILFVGHRPTV